MPSPSVRQNRRQLSTSRSSPPRSTRMRTKSPRADQNDCSARDSRTARRVERRCPSIASTWSLVCKPARAASPRGSTSRTAVLSGPSAIRAEMLDRAGSWNRTVCPIPTTARIATATNVRAGRRNGHTARCQARRPRHVRRRGRAMSEATRQLRKRCSALESDPKCGEPRDLEPRLDQLFPHALMGGVLFETKDQTHMIMSRQFGPFSELYT